VFATGQIIYFSPFYFKNGNNPKNKYFIVLKNVEEKTILASLPTRTNKAPSFMTVSHGCINHDERCFNCYLFEQGKVICDNGFMFDLPTYIYGNEVEDYEISVLKANYGIEGVDFIVIGNLIKKEYEALIKCLKESKSVKRGIKKIL